MAGSFSNSSAFPQVNYHFEHNIKVYVCFPFYHTEYLKGLTFNNSFTASSRTLVNRFPPPSPLLFPLPEHASQEITSRSFWWLVEFGATAFYFVLRGQQFHPPLLLHWLVQISQGLKTHKKAHNFFVITIKVFDPQTFSIWETPRESVDHPLRINVLYF